MLIDGKPSVYIPIFKQTGANTLSVIDGVTRAAQEVTGLPPNMKVGTLFSQAGTILDAVHALEHEAISGALLASLMILIFLGSFRSTFAIFLSIPLSHSGWRGRPVAKPSNHQPYDAWRVYARDRTPGR